MKLINLTLSSFGPYKDKQTIDFTLFNNTDLFLIAGDTGVGKTSILDAISYALYGEVNGSRKKTFTLKCDFSTNDETCYVKLKFKSNEKEYTITRWPKQVKASGLVAENKAELKLPDGKILTKIKEIDTIIVKNVLKINQINFDKLIMLPQGKFQQLLLEKKKDQLETFRILFQTQIYQKITESLFYEEKNLKNNYLAIIENNKQIAEKIIIPSANLSPEDFGDYSTFDKILPLLSAQNEKDENRINAIKSKKILFQDQLKKVAINLQKVKDYEERLLDQEKSVEQLNKLLLKEDEIKKNEKAYNLLPSINKLRILETSKKNAQEKCDNISRRIKELNILKSNVETKLKDLNNKSCEITNYSDRLSKITVELNNLELHGQNLQKANCIKVDIQKHIKTLNELSKHEEIINLLCKLEEIIQKGKNERVITDCLLKLDKSYKELIVNKKRREKSHIVYLDMCKQFYEDAAGQLGNTLQDNEPCPVCGSYNHPNIAKTTNGYKDGFLNKLNELRENFENYLKVEKDNENEINLLLLSLQNQGIDQVPKDKINDLYNEHMITFKSVEKEYKDIKAKITSFDQKNPSNIDHNQDLKKIQDKINKINVIINESKKNIDLIISNIPSHLRDEKKIKLEKEHFIKEEEKLNIKINTIRNDLASVKEKISNINGNYQSSLSEQKEREKELKSATNIFENQLKKDNMGLVKYHEYLNNIEKIEKDGQIAKKTQTDIHNLKLKIKTLDEYLKNPPPEKKKVLNKQTILENEMEKIELEEEEIRSRFNTNSFFEKELNQNTLRIQSVNAKYQSAKHLCEIAKGSINRIGLEQYVLIYYLDQVIVYANMRYVKMNQNRFSLIRNTDPQKTGMELNILSTNSGKTRDITTLSGGETFIASLALSLGLADVVSSRTGGITLGTMFIDEGFGTLDPNYLECVINCLNELKESGRSIGVISHVAELKNRINAQILVSRSDTTAGSTISVIKK